MRGDPLAYFITFRSYGTWLHGDQRGSVDRKHNRFGFPLVAPDVERWRFAHRQMRYEPLVFSEAMRTCIRSAIGEVIEHRRWKLWASNIRTNHVHVVLTAAVKPERVVSDLKARATRNLADQGVIDRGRPVWSRHGSTEYLWTERDLEECCRYVIECQ